MRRGLVAVIVILLAVGCGEDEVPPPAEASGGRVYLLLDGKVWPAFRDAPLAGDAADEIVAELLLGPSDEELERGMTTALPDDLEITGIVVEDGVANVPLDTNLTPEALAQLVYTLTGLPTVRSVDLDRPTQVVTGFDRSDFEEETPAILVESPLADEEVSSPLRVTGTANTFEANFQYELDRHRRPHPRRGLRDSDLGHRNARNLRVHRAVRLRRETGRSSSSRAPRRTARASTSPRSPSG